MYVASVEERNFNEGSPQPSLHVCTLMGKIKCGWIMYDKRSLVYNFIFYRYCFENLGELLKHLSLVGSEKKKSLRLQESVYLH